MPEVSYSVTGTIYDEFNSPLPNAKLSIYEVDLRSEKLLATIATNAGGRYAISFKSTVTEPEYKNPDVRIKVLSGARKLLGQSPVFFNIQSETVINYRLGNTPVTDINEYDRLLALLSPIINEANLGFYQLEENDKYQDISFLAGETGEAFEVISSLANAHQMYAATKLSAEYFYALLRMGFPEKLEEIRQIQSSSVRSAIVQAISGNLISSKFRDGIADFIKGLNAGTAESMLNDSENPTILRKIAKDFLTDKQQKELLETWYESEEEPEKFWERLKSQTGFASGKTLENTQKLFTLSNLLSDQPELTASIFTLLKSGNSVKEISSLMTYTKTDWENAITIAKVNSLPSSVKGNSAEEKKENYAIALEHVFKSLLPTPNFLRRKKLSVHPEKP